MDGFHSSTYFKVLQSLYQFFGDGTECSNYNWHKHHFYGPYFFQFSSKVLVPILLFAFFQFYSDISRNIKVHNSASSLFCWWLLGLVIIIIIIIIIIIYSL